jgi:hypothetical protein
MPFGEFTLLKIPTADGECDHPDRKLSYTWQRLRCPVCSESYYLIKCSGCGQEFTKCRTTGGCNNGKMMEVES